MGPVGVSIDVQASWGSCPKTLGAAAAGQCNWAARKAKTVGGWMGGVNLQASGEVSACWDGNTWGMVSASFSVDMTACGYTINAYSISMNKKFGVTEVTIAEGWNVAVTGDYLSIAGRLHSGAIQLKVRWKHTSDWHCLYAETSWETIVGAEESVGTIGMIENEAPVASLNQNRGGNICSGSQVRADSKWYDADSCQKRCQHAVGCTCFMNYSGKCRVENGHAWTKSSCKKCLGSWNVRRSETGDELAVAVPESPVGVSISTQASWGSCPRGLGGAAAGSCNWGHRRSKTVGGWMGSVNLQATGEVSACWDGNTWGKVSASFAVYMTFAGYKINAYSISMNKKFGYTEVTIAEGWNVAVWGDYVSIAGRLYNGQIQLKVRWKHTSGVHCLYAETSWESVTGAEETVGAIGDSEE